MEGRNVTFRARSVANQPAVYISSTTIEHILTSRYFHTYTWDGEFQVMEQDNKCYLTSDGETPVGLIGWFEWSM